MEELRNQVEGSGATRTRSSREPNPPTGQETGLNPQRACLQEMGGPRAYTAAAKGMGNRHQVEGVGMRGLAAEKQWKVGHRPWTSFQRNLLPHEGVFLSS